MLFIAFAPSLYPVNFNQVRPVFAGDYVNLTVEITSNLSLTGAPVWSRFSADLPNDSYTINYFKYGNNYTSLIIRKISPDDDGGMYYVSASNQCGTSNISVILQIHEGKERHLYM